MIEIAPAFEKLAGVHVGNGVPVTVAVAVAVAVDVGAGVAVFVGVPLDVAVGVGPFPSETTVFPNDGRLPHTILLTVSRDDVLSTSVLPSRCRMFNLLKAAASVMYGTLTHVVTGCEKEAVVEKLNAGPTKVLLAGAVPEVLGSIGAEVVVPAALTDANVIVTSANEAFTLLPVLVGVLTVVGKAISMIG
jgi:hypothetical protein